MQSNQMSYLLLIAVIVVMAGVFLLKGPKPEVSQTQLTQAEIVKNWAEALGGIDQLRTIENSYTKVELKAAGLTGIAEDWQTLTGQHRQSVDLANGIYTSLNIYDGQIGWRVDRTKQIQEISGPELKEEITAAYLSSYSHLIPNRMAGEVEFIGEDASKKYYVLKVQPRGGTPVTYYLDKKTFLPAKSERPNAERLRTTYYSDWRDVSGIKVAFQTRQSSGDPHSEALVTVKEIHFNTTMASTLFTKPEVVTNEINQPLAEGAKSASLVFEINNNHIYLPGQLNGKPIWFVLDSGAASTVISLEKAKELGLKLEGKVEARGAGSGSANASFVRGFSYEVAGIELQDQSAVAIPLEMLKPYEGRAMEAILGYDFISRFVVEIDYANRKLYLHDPKTYRYEGNGEVLPISFDHGLPYVVGRLTLTHNEIREGTFLVDTGASSSIGFNTPFVNANRLLGRLDKTIESLYAGGVGGESKRLLGRWPSLELGKFKIENTVAAFSQDTGGAFANPNHAGLIGGELLQRFKVIFDYSRQQMILESNRAFANPYNYDRSGVYIIAKGDDMKSFTVFRIAENSPASEAGFQQNDLILAIDGRASSEFTLDEIRQLFRDQSENKKILVRVQRGQQTLELTLILRKLI
jgi:predicted aspartyl protease